jgi:uncharacterized protein (DUF39 family)
MTVPVEERNSFEKADFIWLNGVPVQPGPCLNERLGIVNIIVNGTSHADNKYGGGHLFRDLVKGKEIDILVVSHGKSYENQVTLEDIEFARMITTRFASDNYYAIINPNEATMNTLFSVIGLKGLFKEASISGCGEIIL